MKITKVEFCCDVCGRDVSDEKKRYSDEIQVIQTTEQTEGRNTKPYLSNQNLDLCVYCTQNLLLGHGIFSAGAMRHNRYWFDVIDVKVTEQQAKDALT